MSVLPDPFQISMFEDQNTEIGTRFVTIFVKTRNRAPNILFHALQKKVTCISMFGDQKTIIRGPDIVYRSDSRAHTSVLYFGVLAIPKVVNALPNVWCFHWIESKNTPLWIWWRIGGNGGTPGVSDVRICNFCCCCCMPAWWVCVDGWLLNSDGVF